MCIRDRTVRGFIALQGVDSGLQGDRVLLMNVPMAQERYQTREQRNAFGRDLLDRLRTLPGVDAASFGFPGSGRPSTYTIAGQNRDEARRLGVSFVAADHLRTYGIPLRRGRMFDPTEVERGDRVAVINEAAAALWPAGQDPVGRQVRLDVLGQPSPRDRIDTSRGTDVTVIGVMANTRNEGRRSDTVPALVMPYTVLGAPQLLLAVRATSGDPNRLLNPVRAAVRAIDDEQPLGRSITLGEVLEQDVVQPRFTMAMFATFAGLGLALAAVGIYSVLSFHVSRHTHELGLRMALGAPRRTVLGLMLGMGVRLVAVGLAVGLVASAGATRLLRTMVFGVRPTDPIAYVAVLLVLAAITFLACYLPARRAAGVDPMVALRQD